MAKKKAARNKRAFEERIKIPDGKMFERPMGVRQWKAHGAKYGYDTFFEGKMLKEIEKEAKEIGEHFVKFGEKKGLEAIDMIIAVINSKK